MAAPNLLALTTATGKTTGVSLTTTSATSVLSNPANSNTCLKINTLNVANYSNASVIINVSWYDSINATGNSFPFVGNVTIPSGSTLNVIDKTSQYYLEESRSIGATASASNTVVVTCSYEEMR